MADHTKEPWLCDKRTVYALNKKGFNIFSAVVQDCRTSNSELEANARRIVACVNACEGIQTEPLLMPICFNVDRSELERKLGQETMKSIDECNAITRDLYNDVIRQRYKLAKQNVGLFNDIRYTCENQTFGDTYTREVDDVIASVKGGAE